MNKGLIGGIAFIFGAAVGSLVSWQITKRIDEKHYQEDIADLKANYKGKPEIRIKGEEAEKALDPEPIKAAERAKDKPDILRYASTLVEQRYVEGEDEIMDRPYVISPDEFGSRDDDGYEKISLTYYADKILTDDNNEVINTPDTIVGNESLKHFGEYEDDSVFVRNDHLKADFEILLDQRKYYGDVKKDTKSNSGRKR